jgi:hypothetical protein
MISKVEMERFTLISLRPSDDVIAAIKTSVGNPNMAEFGKAVKEAESAAELDAVVQIVKPGEEVRWTPMFLRQE